jgi:hemolysin activation/secretion protein
MTNKITFIIPVLLLASASVYASAVLTPNEIELLRQQQKQLHQDKLMQNSSDVFFDVKPSGSTYPSRLPETESPCIKVKAIRFTDAAPSADFHKFQHALDSVTKGEYSLIGRCVGTQSLQYIIGQVQEDIIRQGYITTQVTVLPQDFSSGIIELTLIPGRVKQIRFSPETSKKVFPQNALPVKSGDYLQLRDLEQGLENFKRLDSVTAGIDIVPAEVEHNKFSTVQYADGWSDLLINWQQNKPVMFTASVDDSGSETTGKRIGSVGLTVDHALNLNDLFRINYSETLNGINSANGQSENIYTSYQVPYGYWLFGVNYSNYRYQQMLVGLNQPIPYDGKSSTLNLAVSRMLYRTQHSKTQLNTKLGQKSSHNYLDDQEVEVQRRKTTHWLLGIQNTYLMNQQQTLVSQLNYQQGIGAFGALDAPEDLFGEGKSRPSIWTGDMTWTIPFSFSHSAFQYQLGWHGQWSPSPLPAPERYSIGGRYSVRGIDDNENLIGDNGMVIQQELSWLDLIPHSQLYLAIDYGVVNGINKSSDDNYLVGSALGCRTYYKNISVEAFVGGNVKSPVMFNNKYTAGFNAGFNY